MAFRSNFNSNNAQQQRPQTALPKSKKPASENKSESSSFNRSKTKATKAITITPLNLDAAKELNKLDNQTSSASIASTVSPADNCSRIFFTSRVHSNEDLDEIPALELGGPVNKPAAFLPKISAPKKKNEERSLFSRGSMQNANSFEISIFTQSSSTFTQPRPSTAPPVRNNTLEPLATLKLTKK